MTAYLVTPPAAPPVTLSELKAHMRVFHGDDDADITARQSGIVAMLDGRTGILGRCIMPQQWAIDVTGTGPHLLPYPDATNVTALSDGDPLDVVITRCERGMFATVADAGTGAPVTITATYGLAEPHRAAAASLVKLMVQRDFDMVAGADYDATTRTIDALINALRWRSI